MASWPARDRRVLDMTFSHKVYPPLASASKRHLSADGLKTVPRLREFFRQVEAGVVSNSRNKLHQTWRPFFSPPLYVYVSADGSMPWSVHPSHAPNRCMQSLTNCKVQSQTKVQYNIQRSIPAYALFQCAADIRSTPSGVKRLK